MIVKRVNLCALDTGSLTLGYVGENDHTQIRINCASVFADYPAAVVSMTVKAPSGVVYPREVETDGQVVIWTITDSDTASAGNGQIQLTFTEDGTVVKTVIAVTTVRASLVGDNPPPDPITDWIDEAGEALAKLEGMTASATQLPAGEDPTAEVEVVDGHYNIALGIPGADAESIIDDTAGVGDVTKVWSANKSATELSELKSEIDRKAPVILRDASGDIVSFADGADGMPLSSCVVSIDPVQAAGTPTPEIPLPISGRTGAQIIRTGMNLLAGDMFNHSGGKTVYLGMNDSTSFPYFLKAGTYTLWIEAQNVGTTMSLYLREAEDSGNTRIDTSTSNLYATFTTEKDGYYRFWAYNSTALTSADIKRYQLALGSEITAYQPYQGQTYAVDWQTAAGTVYGGNLDTVTGVLTVDRAKITLTGAETWQKAGAYSTATYYITRESCGVAQDNDSALCNQYKVGSAIGQDGCMRIGSNSIFFTDSRYTTKDAFAAAVAALYAANTPLEFVGRLETPLTYQLDPVQITTLLGENRIWSDSGAISLTYPADTRTYVDSAITAATDPDGNVISVTGSTPSITGESGKRYICGTVDSISITPPQTGIIDVVFTSGTTPAVLTVPNTVKFPAWFDATSLDASTTYEINIQDGQFGAVMAWQT